MAERVEVTDPHSGATFRVVEGSPLVNLWGKSEKSEPKKPAEKKPAPQRSGK